MRFSAIITIEEEVYDTFCRKHVSSFELTTGYEMESVQRTITLISEKTRGASVPNIKEKSELTMPSLISVKKLVDWFTGGTKKEIGGVTITR